MKCNKKCIHHTVCELKKYEFVYINECKHYEEPRPQGEWIPIKTRPLTEEEKEEYPDWSFIYDCQLPEDEQEVLVSTKWGVRTDIFCRDDGDGCYFEDHCDEEDVLAWMPLPKPYEKEAESEG